MHRYLVLLRGINVGGKNSIAMRELKSCLEKLGCESVRTYIASGNVMCKSAKSAAELTHDIERTLPRTFHLDSELVRALVLTHSQLRHVVDKAPKGFGAHPELYHSDAIFLMGISPKEAFDVFQPREGVDKVWPGDIAIYSQRLSAERTKSRLSAIMLSPFYKQMTIRSWSTTTKLLALMDADAADAPGPQQ